MIALLVILASWLVLRRTVLGVHIYAVGGNESAARLAGIKVWAVLIFVYGVSGLLAGLGGAMQAASGAKPGAAGARQVTVLADVVKVDTKTHLVTLKGPGGNYVEGSRFSDRFNWKQMIGPADQRPGPPPLSDEQALKGSLDVRLAYIVTGDKEVDDLTRQGLEGLSEILRNRTMVALHWLWAYFTFQCGARLITGPPT